MREVIGGYEILLDVREAFGNLNQDDLWELLVELGKHREAFKNKIAVLTRNDEQFNKGGLPGIVRRDSRFQDFSF